MNKWLSVLGGLILLVVAIYAWGMNLWQFGTAALMVLKGGIIWAIIGMGLILIILGISELKE